MIIVLSSVGFCAPELKWSVLIYSSGAEYLHHLLVRLRTSLGHSQVVVTCLSHLRHSIFMPLSRIRHSIVTVIVTVIYLSHLSQL